MQNFNLKNSQPATTNSRLAESVAKLVIQSCLLGQNIKWPVCRCLAKNTVSSYYFSQIFFRPVPSVSDPVPSIRIQEKNALKL